ncbi:MAG TPA: nitrite/sulfite reductase, partial [Rugosibacter sp.]|nr:nitrite/sulfite reductase [Rugosibacter sp.]
STFHPEFAYLPRKFKIAISGTTEDRTAIRVHDVGLQIVKNDAGEIGFTVYAGGGLGRTPLIGQKMIDFLPWQHLLTYTEALVRVYNRYGRRDNPYKARIKILVKALGSDEFSRQVAEEWAHIKDGPNTLTAEEVARVAKQFSAPSYDQFTAADLASIAAQKNEQASDKAFARWLERNVHAHKVPGYAAVTLSLKTPGVAPGDATVAQMQTAADLADEYSFGELRVAHEQNLVLSDVPQKDLYAVWQKAKAAGLASANIGLLADMIVCPGGDFCSLANAKSLPIAAAIHERFSDLDYLFDIGELALNISGCMNSCGHHHLGAIGILGVDKHGEEWYQITLGGAQGNAARIGEVIGRSFAATEIPDVIERMITTYLALRQEDESFGEAVARLGLPPFREAAYRKNETAGEPAHV